MPGAASPATQQGQDLVVELGKPVNTAQGGWREWARLARIVLQGGKPREALVWLERAIVQQPNDAELLHLRGTCLEALGNGPGAFTSYMAALALQPQHMRSLLAVAAMYKSRGLLAEAKATLAQAIAAAPEGSADAAAAGEGLAVVLTDIGTQLKQSGRLHEAVASYEAAVAAWPKYAPAHYNLGVVASESRNWPAALDAYGRAIELSPRYAEAHCNAGVVHKEQGDLDAAIACYEAALAANPNFAIVASNLAVALTDKGTKVKTEGQIHEGIALYERALALHPKYADAHYNLGVAYGELRRPQKAMFHYELAVHFNAQCAEAWNNMGVLHKEEDNLDRAAECYMAALHIRPNFPQALNNLGVIYTSQGRAHEASQLLAAAIAACPSYAEAHNNYGVLQRDVGAVAGALQSYERCLQLCPDSRNAGQNRLLALNYIHPGEETHVCEAHALWGQRFQALFERLPVVQREQWAPDAHRKLRVGYISPDLFTHSVSYFAEAPLTHHNPDQVACYVYNCTPKADAKTARLKAAVCAAGGVWKEVTGLSEVELAGLVREDRIDILVELTGHTANNRLGVMAQCPAPIQATWIGYPNSTGLAAVDYRFTDSLCDPVDTEQTFVEELVRLPGCFLCYTPSIDAPAVAPAPVVTNGFVTFGSFNNLAKITPEVIALWATILQRVPFSRLVLKNKPFACEVARSHFLQQLANHGIEAWRVDLLPLAPGNGDHLATYARMDISLDPFPYAGTTTTTESLYMGVPVITLAGACHAHNVGVSLLAAVGLDEDWVAHSEEEYVELAVRHAQDVQAISALRSSLRQRMLDSPLCDAPAFVARHEGIYRQLWRRWLGCGADAARESKVEAQEQQQGQATQDVQQQQASQDVQQQQASQDLQQQQATRDIQQQQQQQLQQEGAQEVLEVQELGLGRVLDEDGPPGLAGASLGAADDESMGGGGSDSSTASQDAHISKASTSQEHRQYREVAITEEDVDAVQAMYTKRGRGMSQANLQKA